MIILDLEWNRGYDKKPLDEILQIGAVKVNRPGGPIVDTFSCFIRPRIHKSFDMGARKLPELQQSKSSNMTFAGAMGAFLDWCGGERDFAGWGRDDLETLKRNCEFWGQPFLSVEHFYNIQTAFAFMLEAGREQIALWRAVGYCRIPDIFTFHNALNDALYTAVLAEWVTEEALEYVPEKSPRRRHVSFSRLKFPDQPVRVTEPAADVEAILNARPVRLRGCPLCGEKAWVQQWWKVSEELFYATFRCPKHGRFLCRLTLEKTENRQWRGRIEVPEITQELRQEFRALPESAICQCRQVKRKRKRSRNS